MGKSMSENASPFLFTCSLKGFLLKDIPSISRAFLLQTLMQAPHESHCVIFQILISAFLLSWDNTFFKQAFTHLPH